MSISLADFDPTSSTSALGEIVRREINDAGGGTYLSDVETGLARRRAAGSTGNPPPALALPSGIPPWALYAGAAVAAALVLYLVLRK